MILKGLHGRRFVGYACIGLVFVIFCYYIIGMNHTIQNSIYIFSAAALLCLAAGILYLDLNKTYKWIRESLPYVVFILYPLLTVALVWNYMPGKGRGLLFFENALFLYVLQGILMVILLRLKPVMYLSIGINLLLFTICEVVFVLRKTPLLPSDILSVKTAISVVGNYRFHVTPRLLLAMAFSWFMVIVTYQMPVEHCLMRKMKNGGRAVVRQVMFSVTCVGVLIVASFQRADFQFDAFDKERMNQNLGTVLSFYLNCEGIFLEKPDGYSKEKAISYIQEYRDDTNDLAAFADNGNKQLPNVIMIMDEAFSDLSLLGDLELNCDPLAYIHEFQNRDDVIFGRMNVSVWGGNTCNTEFEVLTGNSMAFLPSGSIPYMQYVCKDTSSLCDYFHKLQYETIAIHPYWGECWNRNRVYPQIGFERFIDANQFDEDAKEAVLSSQKMHKGVDFGDLEYVREYISDKESFRQVIRQFEQKKEGQKVFLFNVTMQNHGGYIYKGENMEYTVSSNRLGSAQANQYLSLLSKTDEAFQYLISYFENVKEPTVILFFGDHQPGLPRAIYEELFGRKYEEFTWKNYQERYMVPYYIWANYPLKQVSNGLTSANYLSLLLKQAAGLPLDSWDRFREDTMSRYPVLTSMLCVDASGHLMGRGEVTDEYLERYNLIQYYRIKG